MVEDPHYGWPDETRFEPFQLSLKTRACSMQEPVFRSSTFVVVNLHFRWRISFARNPEPISMNLWAYSSTVRYLFLHLYTQVLFLSLVLTQLQMLIVWEASVGL